MKVLRQRGMILPVILIFFSVIMLLGVTLLSISGNSVVQSAKQVNRAQAHYLAKSGASSMADYIIDFAETENSDSINDFINKLNEPYEVTFSLKGGSVKVHVKFQGNNIFIDSKGTYKEEEREVNLILRVSETTVGYIPTEKESVVVVIDNETNYNQIVPNVVSEKYVIKGTSSDYPVVYHGKNLDGQIVSVQDNINNELIKPVYIPSISVNNSLLINMNNGDRTIIVDNLNLGNKAKIELSNYTSNSILTLIINEGLDMQNGAILFNADQMKNIRIYSEGTVYLKNNSHLYGSIFMSDNSEIIDIQQNAQITGLLYSPISTIKILQNAIINGTVVSNYIQVVSNSEIKPNYIGDLNFFFEDNESKAINKAVISYFSNSWN